MAWNRQLKQIGRLAATGSSSVLLRIMKTTKSKHLTLRIWRKPAELYTAVSRFKLHAQGSLPGHQLIILFTVLQWVERPLLHLPQEMLSRYINVNTCTGRFWQIASSDNCSYKLYWTFIMKFGYIRNKWQFRHVWNSKNYINHGGPDFSKGPTVGSPLVPSLSLS